MFETSQPEENSKTGLIVGGAIVVVLAAFGVFYFTYLAGEPAATPAATPAAAAQPTATPEDIANANPMLDLQILSQDVGRDTQTQTMAMWNVRLSKPQPGGCLSEHSVRNELLRQSAEPALHSRWNVPGTHGPRGSEDVRATE